MSHDLSLDFHPAVKCPHCKKVNRPAISGWGSTFNTRTKWCKYCQQEYTLVVFAEGTLDPDISMDLSIMRGKINRIKEILFRRKVALHEKIIKLSDEYIEQVINTTSN